MQISNLIAIVSAIIALLSFLYMVLINRSQRIYVKNQDTLNKLMIKKEDADITALVIHEDEDLLGRNFYVVLKNIGHSRALNVNIELQNPEWYFTKDSDILPVEFIDPGNEIKIDLLLHRSSGYKSKCTIKWTDINGKQIVKHHVLTNSIDPKVEGVIND